MNTQEVKRKLAAILSADVKGYSRLMGEDEVATLKTLSAYFQIMTTLIQKHQGRVLNIAGDNLLADFESVVDAVQCGVEIQKELRSKNAELAEGRRVEFRIGVNLGDVIREGDTIYGDGVNIAERVQSLADGGGICISGTAFDQVKNKLNLGYKFLGEQTVKNILEPVRVYQVLMEPEAAGKVVGEKKAKPRQWQMATIGLVVVVIVVIVAAVIWKFYSPSGSKTVVASKDKMAFPLPDKPSIAVLPFANMSGDPKKDYLSDGITEEIINALSKIPTVFVIARNSTFTYKGKPVRVQQVSEEMGVQYVMEGSVQWSGDRVRITVQLIDAVKGHHLFSDRYDRELKDIFALQDEITMKALTAMQAGMRAGEGDARTIERGTKNLNAYLKYMQALEIVWVMNKDNVVLARRLVEETLALDPGYANAYAQLSSLTVAEVLFGVSKSPKESLDRAEELAKKAIALDSSNFFPHGALSWVYIFKRRYGEALSTAEHAVSLNPNSMVAWFYLGSAYLYSERYEEAILHFKKSLRLSPVPLIGLLGSLAACYRFLGRYDEAIATYKKSLQVHPNFVAAHIGLAATYVLAGRQEEARAEATEVMRIDPQFSLERYAKTSPLRQALIDQSVELLRKAGLK